MTNPDYTGWLEVIICLVLAAGIGFIIAVAI